jgi:hypothetical protein
MLWWAVVGLAVVLLLAPLRRALLGNGAWRFTVPLVASLAVGFAVGSFLVGFGLPPYALLLAPVAAVLVVAPALRAWLDENLGARNGKSGGEPGDGT